MKNRHWLILTLFVLFLAVPSAVWAETAPTEAQQNCIDYVMVKGEKLDIASKDGYVYVDKNNRTMVPLRAISEAMELDVQWLSEKRQVVINGGFQGQVVFYMDSTGYTIAGKQKQMDTKPVLIDGRVHLPVRFVVESIGGQVECKVTQGWKNGVYRNLMKILIDYDIKVSEYSQHDIAVVNAMIENNGLAAKKNAPAEWDFVEWTDEVPKKVTTLNLLERNLHGKLIVAGLNEMVYLSCEGNNLTAIDIQDNPKLGVLYCHENRIEKMKVANNSSLFKLYCTDNKLKEISNLPESLEWLSCEKNLLTSLQIDNLANLKLLYCSKNQLKELNLDNLLELGVLHCYNNQLTSLDVTNLAKLESLCFGGNPIKTINLQNQLNLKTLDCSDTEITKLDLSKLTSLNDYFCDDKVVVYDARPEAERW